MQNSHEVSPPPSPSRSEEVVVPEEFERAVYQYQQEAFEFSRFPHKSPFDIFTDEDIPPATYAPKFDRNDLFLTNAAELERILLIGAKFMKKPDVNNIPALDIVLVSYGVKRYVTWCLQTENATFAGDIMSGKVVLNEKISQLLADDHENKLSCLVIDNAASIPSMATLPNRLASICAYVLEYGSDLNVETPAYNRHRLIYESVSVPLYRTIMLARRVEREFNTAVSKAQKEISDGVANVITLYTRLFNIFGEGEALSDDKISQHLTALCGLISTSFTASRDAQLASIHLWGVLQANCEQRAEEIQNVYAAQMVLLCRDGVPINQRVKNLMTLNSPVLPAAFNVNQVRFNKLESAAAAIEKLYPVEVLKALQTIGAWTPAKIVRESWDVVIIDDPTYLPPSLELVKPEISKYYREKSLQCHPDRNNGSGEMQTRLNAARDLLNKM